VIERDAGFFVVHCDACPNSTEKDTDWGWESMINDIRDEGWKIVRDEDGDYEHYCPACEPPDPVERALKR